MSLHKSHTLKLRDADTMNDSNTAKSLAGSTNFMSNFMRTHTISLKNNLSSIENRKKSIVCSTFRNKETDEKPTDNNIASEVIKYNDSTINRKDYRGNIISKGKFKQHHISFRDLLNKKVGLCDYVNIPKNKISEKNTSKLKDNDNTSCTCSIF